MNDWINRVIAILMGLCTGPCASGCVLQGTANVGVLPSLQASAAELESTLHEYHRDITNALNLREKRAVNQFIGRVRRDIVDTGRTDAHAAEFSAALAGLRRDRSAESDRFHDALVWAGAMREQVMQLYQPADSNTGVMGTILDYVNRLLGGFDEDLTLADGVE